MKLGFITSILDGWTYEQMMDFASEQGFECVEVACWPEEKAERRYAGVSHIDVERVNQDDEYAAHIMAYAEKAGVEISALAYYPNVMTADKEKRNAAIEHLKNVICASKKLGVGMVTTFIGRDQTKNIRENLELVKEIWPPIIKLAEACDVKIAIENCPMLFGEEQWPGGQNLMTTPPIWREVFKILDSDNLGINYDPSHFIWQKMDYIKPLYEFKDKYPTQLSGGMRQRAALIRTLAIRPKILLLDEAFSALDYQTRLMVTEDIFKILKAENITALMVTHDISEGRFQIRQYV